MKKKNRKNQKRNQTIEATTNSSFLAQPSILARFLLSIKVITINGNNKKFDSQNMRIARG